MNLVCLNFVCKILTMLCTTYFVFLYFYDLLHVLSLVLLLGLLSKNTVAVTSGCIFVVHCNEHTFMILCNFPFFQSLVLHMKHHIFWSICHTGSQTNFILLSFCYSAVHYNMSQLYVLHSVRIISCKTAATLMYKEI